MCAVWHRRHCVGGRSRFRWKLYLSSQAWPLLSTSNRGETAIAKCGNCQHFCIHQRERFLIQEHPTYMWNSMHTVMAWYKKPLRGWTPGSAFSVACYGGIQTYVGTQSIGLTIRVQHFNRASYGLPHLRQHFIFSVPNDRWYFKVCFRLVCPPQSCQTFLVKPVKMQTSLFWGNTMVAILWIVSHMAIYQVHAERFQSACQMISNCLRSRQPCINLSKIVALGKHYPRKCLRVP